jgi:hypothetical protein
MLWTRRPEQTEFRSSFTTGDLYIGQGDQFDDDRRLVHIAASASRLPTRRPKQYVSFSAGTPPSGHRADSQ